MAGGLNIGAPSNPNLAPPGYYILFILNSDGVPSVAEIVRINAAPKDTIPPNTNITAGPTGPIPVNTASFTWSGNDDITPTGDLVYATRLEPLETAFSAFGSATTKSYSNLANGNYIIPRKGQGPSGQRRPDTGNPCFYSQRNWRSLSRRDQLDNLGVGQSDSQRSFTGVWTASTSAGQFGANSLYSNGGGLDTYTWRSGVLHRVRHARIG